MSENKSRAELVRQRHASESTRSQKQKKKKQTMPQRAYDMPSITTRSNSLYNIPQRKQKTEPYRYAIAITPNETSLRLPSLPQIQPGWRLLSSVLTLILIWAIYMLGTAPQFRVTAARVVGNQYLDSNEINSILNLTGRPIFMFTPAQIEEQLRMNYPEILKATVTIDLPNQVIIHVTERQPVITWQQDGKYAWIDESGIAYRPHGQIEGLINVNALAAPPPVAKINNDPFTPAPYITSDMVGALKLLAPYVPAGTAITYDPYYGLGWYDSRGWQAYFGHTTGEMALKLRIYQTMVDWLTQRGIQPTLISVAYTDAPFYRLEQ